MSIAEELREKALAVKCGSFGGSTKCVVTIMEDAADEIEHLEILVRGAKLIIKELEEANKLWVPTNEVGSGSTP